MSFVYSHSSADLFSLPMSLLYRVGTYLLATDQKSPILPHMDRDELLLTSHIIDMIESATKGSYSIVTEQYLGTFEDDMKDCDWTPADEEYKAMKVFPDALKKPGKPNVVQFKEGVFVELSKVKEAVEYYGHMKGTHNSGGRKRPSLSTMKNRFHFIKDAHHLQKLRDYEGNGTVKCNKLANLELISSELEKEVLKHIEGGQILHDSTLRYLVADIIKRNNIAIDNFKISDSWITGWKGRFDLSSRKITKFVAQVRHKSREQIEKDSRKFVEEVNQEMKKFKHAEIFNADQSGFQLEMCTARTLTFTGVKDVHCVVQNVSATTHSYTILPVICADGTLHEKLFVTLKEAGGKFPQKGHFPADNLVVTCHTSHIMTNDLMKEFFKKVVFHKSMPKKPLILVDSWSSWKDKLAIDSVTPRSRKIKMMIIPPRCTGNIQPCDVGIFGGFKKVVKTITSYAQLACSDYKLCTIDPTLKMLSQVWWLMRHPKRRPWVKQGWSSPGYDVPKQFNYRTPKGCPSTSIIFCPYCEETFCFKCFFIDYHKCC